MNRERKILSILFLSIVILLISSCEFSTPSSNNNPTPPATPAEHLEISKITGHRVHGEGELYILYDRVNDEFLSSVESDQNVMFMFKANKEFEAIIAFNNPNDEVIEQIKLECSDKNLEMKLDDGWHKLSQNADNNVFDWNGDESMAFHFKTPLQKDIITLTVTDVKAGGKWLGSDFGDNKLTIIKLENYDFYFNFPSNTGEIYEGVIEYNSERFKNVTLSGVDIAHPVPPRVHNDNDYKCYSTKKDTKLILNFDFEIADFSFSGYFTKQIDLLTINKDSTSANFDTEYFYLDIQGTDIYLTDYLYLYVQKEAYAPLTRYEIVETKEGSKKYHIYYFDEESHSHLIDEEVMSEYIEENYLFYIQLLVDGQYFLVPQVGKITKSSPQKSDFDV